MKVLIANRGAIACRIARTLRRLGMPSVAVYSDADYASLHVDAADEAVALGGGPARENYLDAEKILAACRAVGAAAVHPGYGFLSENAGFARKVEEAGLKFIGPSPDHIQAFGLKHQAKELAAAAGVPLLPGTGLLAGVEEAAACAHQIGFPVMLKSTAGGGGIGMRVCEDERELRQAFEAVARLASANFRDGGVFLEKFIARARHLEIQIFGDGRGRVLAFQERDCSTQRRNQKVIEETPAPGLPPAVRAAMQTCARRLGESVAYRSAGTVEFLYDAESQAFYFLEVNTRLQVEHGVTEEVYGLDLVEWMARLAQGGWEMPESLPEPRGHAIQARVYAEIPHRDFQPSPGRLLEARFPSAVRVETWVAAGMDVPTFYDPMLAKLIAHAPTRGEALEKLAEALRATRLSGIETNLEYLQEILAHPPLREGRPTTAMLTQFTYVPHAVDVIEPGALSTIQDWPGRVGYWAVGVPPSGPMDEASFRLANRLVGNREGTPALEITFAGPTLRFLSEAVVALAGATLDGSLPMNQPTRVRAGDVLRLGAAPGPGCRAYLAVRGGWDASEFLGSRAAFTLGGFGGHAGRALRAGDVLRFSAHSLEIPEPAPHLEPPRWGRRWTLRVIYGPHAAPEFFTEADIAAFFAAEWKVHYNSNSTGIRLIGPKPQWARGDGGEAGLHPSNIHDNAYAIGTVDFTGDMPILLGPDGPSLGGFVCPATVIRADRWILGQLRPGDGVRFVPVALEEAEAALGQLDAAVVELRYPAPSAPPARVEISELGSTRCWEAAATPGRPEMVCRSSGEDYLLVEFGPIVLDFELRVRVHALQTWLERLRHPAILDLTPGVRSLQIHYDNRRLPRARLLEMVREAEASLGSLENFEVPSRVVWLPLSWDDPAIQQAIAKYQQSVNPHAPWCPSNIEFIRRINGLESEEDVRRIVFEAEYLVLGLGDVYLGAPVATPIDPRHRLVTTKYNPARTWTAENSVGIGGAYLCVYGMEGPGGYQLFGRTVQVWNTFRSTPDFPPGCPWLLRFFDRLRFYPVTAAELERLRRDFPLGRYRLQTQEGIFRLSDYHALVCQEAASIAQFQQRQRAAFAAERERWKALPPLPAGEDDGERAEAADGSVPPGYTTATSPLSGHLWKLLASPGERLEAGQPLAIVEAMKMETAICAPVAGELAEWRAAPGRAVQAGQIVAILRPS